MLKRHRWCHWKAIATLVLRVLTLVFLAGSIAVFATDRFKLGDDSKATTFKDIQAYRYVVSAALIGFIYTVIQLPFAIYHVISEKRLILNGCLPEFDFFADQIIAYLLATAIGAGLGVTFEIKKFLKDFLDGLKQSGFEGVDEIRSQGNKFLDRGNIATGVVFLAFICVAVQTVIASISRNSTSSSGRKGFFG